MNYQRHRMHDIINAVTERLVGIERFQAAAELHESIDDIQGALEGCGRRWCS